ncbi:MAG: hypothetical protein B7X91_04105 [Hydrogenophilales bacterium 17-64-11]|nr:MAG: hypothetical protein B7X91_04105 [Hydrogenophilales bacterium 17-64-11]
MQAVPFGKYKNQPYEVLLADAGYAMYLLGSMYAKLQSHHPALLAFLVNRYGLPDSTPEHNRLQNRFLDESFAVRFAMAAAPALLRFLSSLQHIDLTEAWADYVRHELTTEKECSDRRQRWDAPSRMPELRDDLIRQASRIAFGPFSGALEGTTWLKPIACVELEFEKDGADVSYCVIGGAALETVVPIKLGSNEVGEEKRIATYGVNFPFRVEVKPIVGDDYPSILRAMKTVKTRQLLVGEYTGVGATWDELVKVFELSGITVVLLDDVENTPQPSERVEIKPISATEAEAVVSRIYIELTSE